MRGEWEWGERDVIRMLSMWTPSWPRIVAKMGRVSDEIPQTNLESWVGCVASAYVQLVHDVAHLPAHFAMLSRHFCQCLENIERPATMQVGSH